MRSLRRLVLLIPAWGHPQAGINYTSLRNDLIKERAEKLVYVKAEMAARSDNVDC